VPTFPANQSQNQSSLETIPAYGSVYLDGKAVSGANVDAVSVDGTDHRSTTTGDNGTYRIYIKPNTRYNITASYRELRHTVWPVYLPGEVDVYNINLTTTPKSTIEGTGYMTGGPSPGMYEHKKEAGFVMEAMSTKDGSIVSSITNSNGDYYLEVEPDVLYNLTGAISMENKYPIAMFHYRNNLSWTEGYRPQFIVGHNETVLMDYDVPVP
jgi:hypothetical protein